MALSKNVRTLSNITVIIHTKNESRNIEGCIRSARKLSKDILVVDMQSTDDTVARAKGMGVACMSVKNYDYVEPARKLAIAQATGPWIFVLDADERLTPDLVKMLKKHVQTREEEIVEIPRKNIILKHWMKHTAWWPDCQTRFFKKGKLTWGNGIHLAPKFTGKRRTLPAQEKYAIVHQNFTSVAELQEKLLRYASKEPRERIKDMKSVKDVYGIINHDFYWRFIEKEGFKDGIHGYVMSEWMRFYRFMIFMNQWEKDGYPALPGASDLKHQWEYERACIDLVMHPKKSLWARVTGRIFAHFSNTRE